MSKKENIFTDDENEITYFSPVIDFDQRERILVNSFLYVLKDIFDNNFFVCLSWGWLYTGKLSTKFRVSLSK